MADTTASMQAGLVCNGCNNTLAVEGKGTANTVAICQNNKCKLYGKRYQVEWPQVKLTEIITKGKR